MKFAKFFTIIVLAGFDFLVAIANPKDIYLNFFNYDLKCPMWLIISVFFLLGFIANQIICIIDDYYTIKKMRGFKKQIEQLKGEVASLRKLTIKQDD